MKQTKSKNKIVLYPSNWLYNAGVVGFLRVLEFGGRMNNIQFSEDGKLEIPINLFERNSFVLPYSIQCLINWIVKDENLNDWLKKRDKKNKTNEEKYADYIKANFSKNKDEGYKYIRAGGKWFFGSNTPYQNLIQRNEWLDFKFINLLEKSVLAHNESFIPCSFCKRKNINPKWLHLEKTLEKRIITFSDPHTDELGASLGKFPNSFWNNKNSILICPLCVYIFIHHRIAFTDSGKNTQVFINTPHFRLAWDLNKFAEEILKTKKENETRKLLGFSLIEWAIKRRTLLGAWTMMNIEVIIKKWNKEEGKWIIDYFDLPYHITRILLDTEIASLIKKINEEKIFDLIVSGKFSELEKANYFVLRGLLKLKNGQSISDNDPVTKYIIKSRYKDTKHLTEVSKLLPELYAKILKILKQTKGSNYEI